MANSAADAVRRAAIKLTALAQDGLLYAADDYSRLSCGLGVVRDGHSVRQRHDEKKTDAFYPIMRLRGPAF